MKNLCLSFLGVLCAATVGVVIGDETSDDDHRAARLAHMRGIAEAFEVKVVSGEPPAMAKLAPNPVLRYNDSTRRLDESTMWLWTERNRPVAFLAVEFYPKQNNAPAWLFELVSLADARIGASRSDKWKWEAQEPGVVRSSVPGGMVPSDKPPLRLVQARKILQRFTAHEKAAVGGRIELRPLPTPLYRYADEETGVIDGAIFAFANGTNPEVLLILEAHRGSEVKAAHWNYGFAQMTGAEVYASLDEKEIWNQKEADPPAIRDSYTNGWLVDDQALQK